MSGTACQTGTLSMGLQNTRVRVCTSGLLLSGSQSTASPVHHARRMSITCSCRVEFAQAVADLSVGAWQHGFRIPARTHTVGWPPSARDTTCIPRSAYMSLEHRFKRDEYKDVSAPFLATARALAAHPVPFCANLSLLGRVSQKRAASAGTDAYA